MKSYSFLEKSEQEDLHFIFTGKVPIFQENKWMKFSKIVYRVKT